MHFKCHLDQTKVVFNKQCKNALQYCSAFSLEISLFKIEIASGKKMKWDVATSLLSWCNFHFPTRVDGQNKNCLQLHATNHRRVLT
jgi:hypothetical protein